jgi:hypothetical protein
VYTEEMRVSLCKFKDEKEDDDDDDDDDDLDAVSFV